ncbi:alginate O-acetyltransferase complex protein AlgJ [Desulfonatronum zhilinae]|nr:alginate O-acetyltransferase complex protein AlgJ [Desulfonatronum zhilinae]
MANIRGHIVSSIQRSTSRNMFIFMSMLLFCICLLSFVAKEAASAESPLELPPWKAFHAEIQTQVQDTAQRGNMALQGVDGWLFFDQELAHIVLGPFWGESAVDGSKATNPEFADPLPAILDFHAQLQAAGVDLVMVPVPPKALIYPDFISKAMVDTLLTNGSPSRLDPAHQEFYEILRDHGLKVLDLTNVFLEERFADRGPLYCRQDTHWSGLGCVVAARVIGNLVREMPWYAEVATQQFDQRWREVQISGDLWRALDRPDLEREFVNLRQIGRETSSGLELVEPDQASSVVLLGDSHNLVFQAGGDMHARGAGLADQLALELGLPVDLIAVRGSGATPARINLFRRAQRNPDYWQDKKLVIWVFTAREFTHSDGWRLVPIAP